MRLVVRMTSWIAAETTSHHRSAFSDNAHKARKSPRFASRLPTRHVPIWRGWRKGSMKMATRKIGDAILSTPPPRQNRSPRATRLAARRARLQAKITVSRSGCHEPPGRHRGFRGVVPLGLQRPHDGRIETQSGRLPGEPVMRPDDVRPRGDRAGDHLADRSKRMLPDARAEADASATFGQILEHGADPRQGLVQTVLNGPQVAGYDAGEGVLFILHKAFRSCSFRPATPGSSARSR